MAAILKTFDELLNETVDEFKRQFKVKPDLAACAPGRVNLIGEHIDYCDGFVLPMVSICTGLVSAPDHLSSLSKRSFIHFFNTTFF